MKILPLVFTFILLATPAYSQALQVELAAKLQHVDPSFIKKVHTAKPDDEENFRLPKVTVKIGKTAVIRVVREHVFPSGEALYDGATLTITPTVEGKNLRLSGKLSLSRIDQWKPEAPTASSTRQETLFERVVPSGRAVTIKLGDGSRAALVLVASKMDFEGRPVE